MALVNRSNDTSVSESSPPSPPTQDPHGPPRARGYAPRLDDISTSKTSPPPSLSQNFDAAPAETSSLSLGARLAVFTVLALPVTLLPFITLRRQLISLHRKVDEIRSTTDALQRELKGALVDLSIRKDEQLRIKEMLEDARQKLEATRRDTQRLQLARSADEKEYQRRLQEIMASTNYTQSQLARLRELGPSLADVATFMQEMDIQQGYTTQKQDGRGIERLRRVALELEGLSKKANGTMIAKLTTHEALKG